MLELVVEGVVDDAIELELELVGNVTAVNEVTGDKTAGLELVVIVEFSI